LAIRQKLADASPAVAELQQALARAHHNIGNGLAGTGRPEEALTAYRKALAIQQKLADANPAVAGYQSDLARSHYTNGALLLETGKPAEALQAYQKALAIYQKLTDANPPSPTSSKTSEEGNRLVRSRPVPPSQLGSMCRAPPSAAAHSPEPRAPGCTPACEHPGGRTSC
jgi:tetratricopeptide (TPR) repeat protein